MKVLSNEERPHVVDQDVTVSWNGKQAKGWAAADNVYFWGSLQRQQMIQEHVRREIRKSGGKIGLHQLVQSMEEPATQDIRGLYVLPVAARALGKVSDPESAAALRTLRAWRRAGAHRRDLDKDGVYDDDAAVTLMDAWWPELARSVFAPALGKKTLTALRTMVPYDAELEPGRPPSAPAFSTGWYGFVHKDLRQLFTPSKVRGKWSRSYCGFGIRSRCRKALRGLAGQGTHRQPRGALRHGRLRQRPPGQLLRQEPLHHRLGDRRRPVPLPEPPDLPADGRAHRRGPAPLTKAAASAKRPSLVALGANMPT